MLYFCILLFVFIFQLHWIPTSCRPCALSTWHVSEDSINWFGNFGICSVCKYRSVSIFVNLWNAVLSHNPGLSHPSIILLYYCHFIRHCRHCSTILHFSTHVLYFWFTPYFVFTRTSLYVKIIHSTPYLKYTLYIRISSIDIPIHSIDLCVCVLNFTMNHRRLL